MAASTTFHARYVCHVCRGLGLPRIKAWIPTALPSAAGAGLSCPLLPAEPLQGSAHYTPREVGLSWILFLGTRESLRPAEVNPQGQGLPENVYKVKR